MMADENGITEEDLEGIEPMTVNVNGESEEFSPKEVFMMNELRQMTERLEFARKAGLSHDGDRDIWEELGYPKENDIDFDKYVSQYQRGGIAGRIVDLPAMDTWKNHPTIRSSDETDNNDQFDEAFSSERSFDSISLVNRVELWHNLARVDRLAGVGKFAVLFLGFSDVESVEQLKSSPVEEQRREQFQNGDSFRDAFGGAFDDRNVNLMYVSPYSFDDVEVDERFEDPVDRRFREPKIYNIDMSGTGDVELSGTGAEDLSEVEVHADRVLHVAEDALFNEEEGRPRLKRSFNRIMDLEKTLGPWAEAFWKEIIPDWAFNIDPEKKFSKSEDLGDFEDEIQKFLHKIQRYFVQQGVDVERLTADIKDMSDGVMTLLKMISGDTGIPLRKLIGSERGDLASTQDERNWASTIEDRRDWYAEPVILDPFIQLNMKVGVLPVVNYEISWPGLFTLTEEEKAEIQKTRSEAALNYENAALSGMTISAAEARAVQGRPVDELTAEELEEFREEEDQEIIDMIGS